MWKRIHTPIFLTYCHVCPFPKFNHLYNFMNPFIPAFQINVVLSELPATNVFVYSTLYQRQPAAAARISRCAEQTSLHTRTASQLQLMYFGAMLRKHGGTRGTFFSVLYFIYTSLQIGGELKHLKAV